MIQLKSLLKCIDNTGALVVECINVIGRRKSGSLGDEIVCVIQQARAVDTTTRSAPLQNKLKKGDVARLGIIIYIDESAVIVRVKKECMRADGSFVRFDDNACVIINKQGQPVGNRIMGVVANEVRQKRWAKIVSLAPKIV